MYFRFYLPNINPLSAIIFTDKGHLILQNCMEIKDINASKIVLLQFFEPYNLFAQQDKEVIYNILSIFISNNIQRLPSNSLICQLTIDRLPEIVEQILFEVNSQTETYFIDYNFRTMLLQTSWIYRKNLGIKDLQNKGILVVSEFLREDSNLRTEKVKSFVVDWLSEIFSNLVKHFEGAIVKFCLNKIIEDSVNFEDYLRHIYTRLKSKDKRLVYELRKLRDVYRKEFNIISKNNFILEIGLGLEDKECILENCLSFMKISLIKLFNYINFNKSTYQDLHLNSGKLLKDKARFNYNTRDVSEYNKLDYVLNINDKEDEVIILATKAISKKLTINEFQKLLLLIAHPKIIIDLRKYNKEKQNLLVIASKVKHPATRDLINAIFAKILVQWPADESVQLFNKYFCFDWTLKTKDLYNFKRILSIYDGIDLTNAEVKTFFTSINNYDTEEKYNFLKAIILELTEKEESCNINYEILLHEACKYNFKDLVEILLKHGAQINFALKDGITPLHLTASNGNLSLVKLLIENGASVNIEDSFGHTALYFAASYGHYNIQDFLLNLK